MCWSGIQAWETGRCLRWCCNASVACIAAGAGMCPDGTAGDASRAGSASSHPPVGAHRGFDNEVYNASCKGEQVSQVRPGDAQRPAEGRPTALPAIILAGDLHLAAAGAAPVQCREQQRQQQARAGQQVPSLSRGRLRAVMHCLPASHPFWPASAGPQTPPTGTLTVKPISKLNRRLTIAFSDTSTFQMALRLLGAIQTHICGSHSSSGGRGMGASSSREECAA